MLLVTSCTEPRFTDVNREHLCMKKLPILVILDKGRRSNERIPEYIRNPELIEVAFLLVLVRAT